MGFIFHQTYAGQSREQKREQGKSFHKERAQLIRARSPQGFINALLPSQKELAKRWLVKDGVYFLPNLFC
jgi:hypothetical protein